MKRKVKYWTATYSSGVSGGSPCITQLINWHFTLASAKTDKARINSKNAVVVRADANENPTLEVVE